MRRTIVALVLAGLAVSACASRTYQPTRPEAEDLEGSKSVCSSYSAPPVYYMCWLVRRPTCQQRDRSFDLCMESRGWKRVR